MAEVISFKAAKKKQQKAKAKASTLCKEGHHQWRIDQNKQFEPRSGKLITVYICQRCGKKQTKLL